PVVNALVPEQMLPLTAPVIAAPTMLLLAGMSRSLVRLLAIRRMRRIRSGSANGTGAAGRALIVGAGEVGRRLADSMLRDLSSRWDPVAFLDDDPRKRNLRHAGVAVRGTTQQMIPTARATDADVLVIATASIDADTIGALTTQAQEIGLRGRIVPQLHALIDGVRHPDRSEISEMLAGRIVLVTGAGGSIVSELCRQISTFGPRELVMLDRDESALHALLLSMHGAADLGNDNMVLADIRDRERIDAVFAEHRPEVVFHAAALKHVNMLENAPDEAYKTNVLGTHNVLEASHRRGVQKFVNISTDKAADPHNVLGLSKRVAEGLTAQKAEAAERGTWVSVRFGNVLATRG